MISLEPAPMLEDKEKWSVFILFSVIFSSNSEDISLYKAVSLFSSCITIRHNLLPNLKVLLAS